MGRNVIKMQIDQMKAKIKDLQVNILVNQLHQRNKQLCREAKANIERETGEKCEGCCVTRIATGRARQARGKHGPSGRYTSVEGAYSWFIPKPCKNTVAGFDYEDFIYVDISAWNKLLRNHAKVL